MRTSLTENPVYKRLQAHRNEMAQLPMRRLFAEDSERFERFSLEAGELLVDYSKNRVTEETMALLVRLAEEAGVPAAIERMFAGEKINVTEGRAVLHVALRNRSERPIRFAGEDVMPAVRGELAKMRCISDEVGDGTWKGFAGERITDVVNLGIGGSDLGPLMVAEALSRVARLVAGRGGGLPPLRRLSVPGRTAEASSFVVT